MADLRPAIRTYATEVSRLANSTTTTEQSYYPAIKTLVAAILDEHKLPFDVRAGTSERRAGRGADHPDLALYDGGGQHISVPVEVKAPGVELTDLAVSTDQDDQIGRYLAQTRVLLLSNVRGFGLLTVDQSYTGAEPVPPERRRLEWEVSIWPDPSGLVRGDRIPSEVVENLAGLIEQAATRYATIVEPDALARILARIARQAKAALPDQFETVRNLLEDFGKALGVTFEEKEGEEFFRSSLIQTVFYSLFAGWCLWHRSEDSRPFEWGRLVEYLRIPFIGALFHELAHPLRLGELNIRPFLDHATETLNRVDRYEFFSRFVGVQLEVSSEEEHPVAESAITYFYEPFLEAFDPELRRALGVWYTPKEIVRYQVRKVDKILREELGCNRGFADDRVVVLDPCCGTGAYLLEVVRCIAEQLRREGDETLVAATLLNTICSRIIGFEILTAPFVISQLQLFLMLTETGASPAEGDRPAVFLTNALTGWDDPEQVQFHFPELEQERQAATEVKREARIIVVLGNPPYNRFAGVAQKEEAHLVDHYKGITRDERGRQVGKSLLFTKYGVKKQLLDDLYIRFIRLAEKRIGEEAVFGVVSYISNSSYLTGRSHPLMRESLLSNFHQIWIDNTRGNAIACERTPWGDACDSVFQVRGVSTGNMVGTCISTFLKQERPRTQPEETIIHYRDFWGRSELKRQAILDSLEMAGWPQERIDEAAQRPEGPRLYETVPPTYANRWMFAPRDVSAGYEAWPALDEIFTTSFQGVNPNRGLSGSVVDIDGRALADRMRDYFNSRLSSEEIEERYPELMRPRARYNPEETRSTLLRESHFSTDQLLHYLIFPFDVRHLYWERRAKFLNECRPDFYENLMEGNEFLVTVPMPRRRSETRPVVSSVLVDLHFHDRGAVCIPAVIKRMPSRLGETLPFLLGDEDSESSVIANLAPPLWETLRDTWGLNGDLASESAKELSRNLLHASLAIMHAPAYQEDHRDGLAEDWAHLPVPKDQAVFDRLTDAGDKLRILLDLLADSAEVLERVLGEHFRTLGRPTKVSGSQISQRDLEVRVNYYGSARGKWDARAYDEADGETELQGFGDVTGDLWLNDKVYLKNVPRSVWEYELGGYPVIKKWLGYRQFNRLGRPLTLNELRQLRSIVQRIAAIIHWQSGLDQLYQEAASDAFCAEELGFRLL